MKLLIFFTLIMVIAIQIHAKVYSVTNSGTTFTPANIAIELGDTLIFTLESMHNAMEVSKTVYNSNTATSNGGFNLPFGGGEVVLTDTGTYYYVCKPHASFGMKGTVTVKAKPVNTDTIPTPIPVPNVINYAQLKFLLYPNPATNMVNINTQYLGQINVNIFDLTGKLVLQNSLYSSGLVQISNLHTGKYLVQITMGNISKTVTLLKQ